MSDDHKPPSIVTLAPKDELKALVQQMRRQMEDQLEFGRMLAKIRCSNYLAYLSEGFTDEQALALCTK